MQARKSKDRPGIVAYVSSSLRKPSTIVLLLLSLYALGLTVARVALAHNRTYTFLVWNLFLAFIPWFISDLLVFFNPRSRIIKAFFGIVLILFFPNATYILTDLLHLGKGHGVPLWYDLLLILSFSLCGLYYAFVSLLNLEWLLHIRNRFVAFAFSSVLILVSSFGIYLGRFLRWNSWDILTNAYDIASDAIDRVVRPTEYAATWAFTFLFGFLLIILYNGFKAFARQSGSDKPQISQKDPGR